MPTTHHQGGLAACQSVARREPLGQASLVADRAGKWQIDSRIILRKSLWVVAIARTRVKVDPVRFNWRLWRPFPPALIHCLD